MDWPKWTGPNWLARIDWPELAELRWPYLFLSYSLYICFFKTLKLSFSISSIFILFLSRFLILTPSLCQFQFFKYTLSPHLSFSLALTIFLSIYLCFCLYVYVHIPLLSSFSFSKQSYSLFRLFLTLSFIFFSLPSFSV